MQIKNPPTIFVGGFFIFVLALLAFRCFSFRWLALSCFSFRWLALSNLASFCWLALSNCFPLSGLTFSCWHIFMLRFIFVCCATRLSHTIFIIFIIARNKIKQYFFFVKLWTTFFCLRKFYNHL